MGAGTAARIGLLLLRDKRTRNYLLAAVVGVVVGLGLMLIFLVSSVGAIFSMCQQTASELSEGNPSSTPTSYTSSEPSEAALADIPGNYLDAYQKAGEEYGMDWAFLAAVGKQETNHGQDIDGCASSEDGARGPMQFIPSTWASEGVDGNGDGKTDPCDVEDAVHSAASYLNSLGAPPDYHGALCSYYGACGDANADYADEVMAQAEEYRKAAGDSGGGSDDSSGEDSGEDPNSTPAFISPLMSVAHAQEEGGSSGGPQAVFPVDLEDADNYEDDWGDSRPGFTGNGSHEGTDIFADKGTPLYSMVDGTVEENLENDGDDYSDVGGYNVLIRATEDAGPIKEGDMILYGHMAEPPSVEVGDEVSAGQQVGEVGDTGYGPEVTTGEMDPHVHVGWYDDTGERAESASGAMNPYPMLQWVEEEGGASGRGDDSSSGGSESAPSASPVQTPTSEGLPDHCTPFRVAGFIQDVGQGVSNVGSGGGEDSSGDSSGKIGGGPEKGRELVEAAKQYMGVPYVIGGLEPSVCNPQSIDCDCIIYLALKDIGAPTGHLNGDPQQYLELGESVEGPPQAGDIIVYDQSGILADVPGGHVAIATGNGNEIVHAIPPEATISPDYSSGQGPVSGVRRIF